MNRIAILGMLVAALSVLPLSPAAAADQWLHVSVDEHGPDGATVRVNVPVDLVTKVLPLVRHERFSGGKVKVRVGDEDMSAADLRAMWEAVRSSRDGDYVTVNGPKEKVRVAKRGEFLLVEAREDKEKPTNVEVKIPLAVVDALFSGAEKDELNVVAAVEALARYGGGDLVTVNDDDSHVRIWIDSIESSK
ncbi:MAG: hypothetical protein LAO51_08400 [Acidobacteriia bacterium]|nr:hypothetical protein [Terriglobia bacterium]